MNINSIKFVQENLLLSLPFWFNRPVPLLQINSQIIPKQSSTTGVVLNYPAFWMMPVTLHPICQSSRIFGVILNFREKFRSKEIRNLYSSLYRSGPSTGAMGRGTCSGHFTLICDPPKPSAKVELPHKIDFLPNLGLNPTKHHFQISG